ncbi:MAG: lysophospholipase L1-like esterase [Verrucomicrobiales bacterium]|jgi:lysophospholipase L1-like esterase
MIDPYVSFSEVEPLFEMNPDATRYEIRKERQPIFVADHFAARKSDGAFRIFCFGGSTVQGRPYSTPTAFSTWLRLSLESAYPERTFEVVNCGGISYASYRLVPIVSECLDYQPDLFVLCTGHNEFLEDRTYASVRKWNGTFGKIMRSVSRLHLYRSMAGLVTNRDQVEASRPILKREVDALLDYQRGLEVYHRDESWRVGVVAHFKENVRRMIQIADGADVPLLVLAPPSNLKDCPPFKSEPTANLSSDGETKRDTLLSQAERRRKSAPWEVTQLLAQASAIDPDNAGIHFALGHSQLAIGDLSAARESLELALETDICPLRMLAAMRVQMQTACDETATRFIDLKASFEESQKTRILGTGILVDHIHPSLRGHQLIADQITDALSGWVLADPAAENDWKLARSRAYANHLRTLDDLYYAHGRQRLENLQHWTEGRADGLPIETHSPKGEGTSARLPQ